MLPIWILVGLKCTDKDSSAALYVREFVGNTFGRLLTQVNAESGDMFILHWVEEGYSSGYRHYSISPPHSGSWIGAHRHFSVARARKHIEESGFLCLDPPMAPELI